jgi:hypothetical protein
MKASTKRRVGMALVTGATAAGLVAGTGPASAQKDYTNPTGPRTIKIVMKGKDPRFKGPKTISKGAKLTIVNKTKAKKIGPHTFTLIKKGSLPKGKKEIKKCEKFELAVCAAVLKAHKANPDTGEVKKPDVDKGKKGWDKSFGKKGDTWFSPDKGTKETRKASAARGKTLYYFCAVHPFMQGKIKVVE